MNLFLILIDRYICEILLRVIIAIIDRLEIAIINRLRIIIINRFFFITGRLQVTTATSRSLVLVVIGYRAHNLL